MVKYQIVQVQPATADTVARLIRDDVNGALLEVSSGGVAVRITIKDLVDEVNRIETEKRQAEQPKEEVKDVETN